MCACDFNFTCAKCEPSACYDDPSYWSPDEIERQRRERELSTVDFLSPFRDAA